MGRRIVSSKDIELERINTERKGSHSDVPETEKNITTPLHSQLDSDDYKSRLLKYIPAEIVAAFVSIDAIIKSVDHPSVQIYWIVFFILLILTPFYVWKVTNMPYKSPAKMQIFISTISFIVWVFALGGPFNYSSWYHPYYGALLLPIWTLFIPILKY